MNTKKPKGLNEQNMHYLQLLSSSFPNIASASTEIINLEAILNLPKGTEHFLADLHGESLSFKHVLKNASGNIRRKVSELFKGDIRESERRELCTLIYYPEEKIELIKAAESDIDDWYHITIHGWWLSVAMCRQSTHALKYASRCPQSLPISLRSCYTSVLMTSTRQAMSASSSIPLSRRDVPTILS